MNDWLSPILPGVDLSGRPSRNFDIRLEYKGAGPDLEQHVRGKVIPPAGECLEGYAIEVIMSTFTSTRQWRSGTIELSPEVGFSVKLQEEKNSLNMYDIRLIDSQGTVVA